MKTKIKPIISWILVVLLALGFALAAVAKFSGAQAEMFATWGYPAWFETLVATCESLGAIMLLIPKTTRWSICGLSLIMFGAVYTHLANGESSEVVRPILFLALLWAVWWLRSANMSNATSD